MELMFWNYWWPQLWKYMKKLIEYFNVCAWAKNPCHHLHGFLQPLSIHVSPCSSISMDFITNLPPFISYDSILVVVDHLTKKVHFIMCNKNNNWWKNNQISPWSCFLVSWSSWTYHFWLWASICIQVLKVTLWTFKCEGDVVITFPP